MAFPVTQFYLKEKVKQASEYQQMFFGYYREVVLAISWPLRFH